MYSSITACPQCALEFSAGEVFCAVDGARLVPVAGGGLVEAPDPLLGQTLAERYRIERKIGEGGMGIVYEAVHVVIEKRVALKVLREDFSHRPDVVERFRQEARSASRIGHENIIDISDFGVTPGGAHFFAMELLHGRDLAEELETKGPLPLQRALHIAAQCARALGAAHAKGIIHRDIKPENIFLVQRDTGEDFVKIVDFGIAKMSDFETQAGPGRRITKTGMIFGTPEYMSPEQGAGKELDQRVDIYALGIILYELLTGRVPFLGDTFMGILTQHMFEPVPPLQVANPCCNAPEQLERVIAKAIAKRVEDRYQSMEELAADLTHVLSRLSWSSSSAPPPGTITHVGPAPRPLQLPATPARRRPGRARPALVVGAALALLALAAGALFLRTGPSARSLAQVANPPPAVPHVPAQPRAAGREPAPAREVAVEVLSEPRGASVQVDGRTVCAATPCRFSARRGQALRLAVHKAGFRSGSTELSPEHDLNQVELVLRRREGPRRGNRMQGDLMLPDAFGKR